MVFFQVARKSCVGMDQLFILSLINGPCKIQWSPLLSSPGLHSNCYKGRKRAGCFASACKTLSSLIKWLHRLMTTLSNIPPSQGDLVNLYIKEMTLGKGIFFVTFYFPHSPCPILSPLTSHLQSDTPNKHWLVIAVCENICCKLIYNLFYFTSSEFFYVYKTPP